MHEGNRRLKRVFEKTKSDVSIASTMAQQQSNHFEHGTTSAYDPMSAENCNKDVSHHILLLLL